MPGASGTHNGRTRETLHEPPHALALGGVSLPFDARARDGAGLRDVTLQVAHGERVALVGPSGVGKTSLLRAIAGLHPITAGAVHVRGRDVGASRPEARGVVYLHQTPALFPHLSVLDNVGFPREVRGARRADARASARELLARVQLDALADRPASALSGGQRHRVALARALAAEPAVLLLDEPFAALDPALRADVRDAVFAALAIEPRPAVLLVTHDIDEAAAIADRIAVLLHDTFAQVATPAALLARPASLAVARFLGIPNIVLGVVEGDRPQPLVRSALGAIAIDGAVLGSAFGPGARVAIVARADAFGVLGASMAAAARMSPAIGTLVDAEVESVSERVSGVVLRVRVGDALLAVHAPHTDRPEPGARVTLQVDSTKLHIVSAD